MKITEDIIYAGVNDHQVDLFEGQYKVPNGMAYNSYVILDEKTAVMDTVDANFADEWLANVAKALDGRKPDYLIVQHMEPDHSANIENFVKAYPEATVVANTKTFAMMKNFFPKMDLAGRKLEVKDGESLTLGKHVLTFVFAPMVHWPEVMVTYDSTDKVLFAADGFGKFGALDREEPWDDEARRYFIGIVGKYGLQVQKLLKVAGTLDIRKICSAARSGSDGKSWTLSWKNTISGLPTARRERRRCGRLHFCIRHIQKKLPSLLAAEAGGKGLPEGRCLRSGKRRHGCGRGGRFPLRQAGIWPALTYNGEAFTRSCSTFIETV